MKIFLKREKFFEKAALFFPKKAFAFSGTPFYFIRSGRGISAASFADAGTRRRGADAPEAAPALGAAVFIFADNTPRRAWS